MLEIYVEGVIDVPVVCNLPAYGTRRVPSPENFLEHIKVLHIDQMCFRNSEVDFLLLPIARVANTPSIDSDIIRFWFDSIWHRQLEEYRCVPSKRSDTKGPLGV